MDIKLFDADEMKTGKGGGKRGTGEKYSKYKNAIAPHLQFLKDEIEKKADGMIRVKVDDIAKAMGMPVKHPTSIYWGLKFVLFNEGIVVTTGQTIHDEPALVMRKRLPGDTLPDSLSKHMIGAGKAGAGKAGAVAGGAVAGGAGDDETVGDAGDA